jgi:hypothetical protein
MPVRLYLCDTTDACLFCSLIAVLKDGMLDRAISWSVQYVIHALILQNRQSAFPAWYAVRHGQYDRECAAARMHGHLL